MTSRAIILVIIMIIASGFFIRILHRVKDIIYTQSDVYEALERKRLNAHIVEMEMELGIIPKTNHFFGDGTPVPPPPLPRRGTVSGGPR